MSAYDFENILDNVESILKTNLNTKISEVNTEKSDSITLNDVDSSAYAFQSLNNEIVNFDPFIVYGLIDIESDGIGPYTSSEAIIQVVLVACDTSEGVGMDRRMFRYQRAIKEVIESNWQSGGLGNKIKIDSLMPMTVKRLDGSEEFKAIGIEIKTNLA